FVLKDLGSTNGTFLDGRRVTIAEIASGQQLKCGANYLLFTVADDEGVVTTQADVAPAPASIPLPAAPPVGVPPRSFDAYELPSLPSVPPEPPTARSGWLEDLPPASGGTLRLPALDMAALE